jgi:hypothetical protein
MDSKASEIQVLTNLLRTGTDPFWERLRELLTQRGVNPSTSILVECFPDDNSFQFGILIAQSSKIIQFGFDYLHRSIAEGQFSEWEDLTERYQDSPHRESIRIGIDSQCTGTKFGPG